jgi:hypothetical protein
LEREQASGRVQDLVAIVASRGGEARIPEQTIDDIIAMIPAPASAFNSCVALAEIAPRARRAIPAIRREIEVMVADESQRMFASPTPTIARMRDCLAGIENGRTYRPIYIPAR